MPAEGCSIAMDYPPPGATRAVGRLKSTTVYAATAVVVVILILAVGLSLGFSGSGISSSTRSASSSVGGTTSVQGENQTIVATYVSSLSSSTEPTISTTSTSTSTTSVTTTQPQLGAGSFTYTPSSQVKVLSVAATVFSGQGGKSGVEFSVKFENIGASPIYVLNGGGSGLNVTVASGDSVVESSTGIRCELVEVLGPLNTGANATAIAPGCWSGYAFQLVQPGMAGVKMTLTWANGISGGASGAIEIDAEFDLS